jgi:hypothetical protein
MEPNTGVLVASLIFLFAIIAVDRVASVLQAKSRDEADVKKKELDAAAFGDLGDKLVATMQAMHGGVAGDAMRRAMTIDPEGRQDGRTVQYPPRDNGQHRGTDFSAPRPAETASR